MRKQYFPVIMILVIAAVTLLFLNIGITKEINKTSEALEALNFWAVQRAYPNQTFPKEGYVEAFELSKSMKSIEGKTIWHSIGPYNFGGRTISIAINPQNSRTLYAGSASGGLWRSYSAGEGSSAWKYVDTGFPVLGVGAIAISKNDSNLIFIGTGEVYSYQNSIGGIVNRLTRGSYGMGILKSTDGGNSWSKSLDWSYNQERGVEVIRINPLNPNTIFAGTTEGIYRSYDCGETWQSVDSTKMVTDILINSNDTTKLIAACGNFGSSGTGIYISSNSGESWNKVTANLPSGYQGKALFSASAIQPEVVYASIGGGLSGTWLCKSTDFGESWSVVSTTDYAKYQGWYSHIVVVKPDNPNMLLTAGIDIYKSTNGGNSLTQKSNWWAWTMGRTIAGEEEGPTYYSHADHHAYVIDPNNPNVVYFANDGGVFKTSDFGETFHGRNGGYQSQQFYNGFSSLNSADNLSIGGLQDNASAIYDGSTNWIRIIGGDGSWTAINQNNPNILYGSYYNLSIQRSQDHGSNWHDISPNNAGNTAFISPFMVAPLNQAIIYGAGTKVVKSSNGGTSWVSTNGGLPLTSNRAISMAISFQDEDVVYVGFAPENGTVQIFRTRDGGMSWSDIASGLPNRYPMDIAVDPQNDSTLFVVLSGFGTSHLLKTTNDGIFWEDLGAGLPDVPTSAVAIDPADSKIIYVGNDLGVYVTTDGGTSWNLFASGLPQGVIVMDLSIIPSIRKIRAATHGNGVYEADMVNSTSVEGNQDALKHFVLYQNYPNPFYKGAGGNSTTTIKYSILGTENIKLVQLKIYDAIGREISTLVNKRQTPGNYSVKFNVSNLPSGVYFYRLKVGDYVATKKMNLIR